LDVCGDSIDVGESVGVIGMVVRITEVFIKLPEGEAVA
jgi:hypothetical protein